MPHKYSFSQLSFTDLELPLVPNNVELIGDRQLKDSSNPYGDFPDVIFRPVILDNRIHYTNLEMLGVTSIASYLELVGDHMRHLEPSNPQGNGGSPYIEILEHEWYLFPLDRSPKNEAEQEVINRARSKQRREDWLTVSCNLGTGYTTVSPDHILVAKVPNIGSHIRLKNNNIDTAKDIHEALNVRYYSFLQSQQETTDVALLEVPYSRQYTIPTDDQGAPLKNMCYLFTDIEPRMTGNMFRDWPFRNYWAVMSTQLRDK